MKKIILKIFAVCFFSLLVFFISICFIESKNPLLDIRFYERLVTFPRLKPYTSLNWKGYQPREIIKGNYQDLEYYKENEKTFSKEALEKLSKYVEERNSISLLVLYKNKIAFERYYANTNDKTLSDSASMAKTVLSLMIGKAIEEKYINSEDDLVYKYIPEWKDDERNKITIKNLLQMSSGLYCSDNLVSPFSDIVKMHGGFYLPEIVLNVKAVKPPNTEYSYNNVNSQILEILLERATKKRYADYLSEKLWKPLQAENANLWLDHENGTPRAYCCLFASAKDWAKLGLMLLNNGFYNNQQIVSKEWLKKMIQPSEYKKNYGYHIWLGKSQFFSSRRISEPFLDESMIFLDGKGKQRVFVIPSKELVIVRMGDDVFNWDESFITNTLIRDLDKK